MKIAKCSRVQSLRINELSEMTGVSIKRLTPVLLHHGLMKLKEGEELFDCDEVKIAHLQPSLKEGFDKLHRQTGEKLSTLYGNALHYGILHVRKQVAKMRRNGFVGLGNAD